MKLLLHEARGTKFRRVGFVNRKDNAGHAGAIGAEYYLQKNITAGPYFTKGEMGAFQPKAEIASSEARSCIYPHQPGVTAVGFHVRRRNMHEKSEFSEKLLKCANRKVFIVEIIYHIK